MSDKQKVPHVCREMDWCCCSVSALEPSEECPIHTGTGPWPPRCATCGRFMLRAVAGPYVLAEADTSRKEREK